MAVVEVVCAVYAPCQWAVQWQPRSALTAAVTAAAVSLGPAATTSCSLLRPELPSWNSSTHYTMHDI